MDTVQCDPCGASSRSISALYWCPFCQEAFCRSCCQFHMTMKITRAHKVQNISEVSFKEKHHHKQTSRMKFQELTPLTFNEKTQLREIDNILQNMDGLGDTALTLKKMNFDMKMKNESRKVDALRKVLIFKNRLKELADEFEKHISTELDHLQHEENVVIENRIEECENIFSGIEMSKDLAQSMKTEYITSQTIHKVNAARQRCEEYKNALQRIHSRMDPVTYNLAIDKNVADAINMSPGIIGKIEVTHEDDNPEDAIAKQISSQATITRNDQSRQSRTKEKQFNTDSAQPQKLHEIHLQREDDHDEPMISAICPLASINFLTLDRNNDKLHLVRPDGDVLMQYVFTSQVWDMTLLDETSVAVTVPDSEKIILVKIQDGNLVADRLIKVNSICYGICAIEGCLVLTVKGGYVKIVTKAGEEVASIRHSNRGEILFKDPQYVEANKDGNELYVTDNEFHTVTGLCLTGVRIDTNPKFIFRSSQLRNPTGLCLDRRGDIYVSGSSTHNVVLLSREGRFLKVIVSGIVNPQTVALSFMEDRMLVSSLHSSNRSKYTRNVIEVFRLK